MFKNSTEIFDFIKKNDVKLVDVRFIDLPGIQHHFNVPVESFDEAVFTDGLMFDGSSIRGFQSIHESDMKLLPVPGSALLIHIARKRRSSFSSLFTIQSTTPLTLAILVESLEKQLTISSQQELPILLSLLQKQSSMYLMK